MSSTESTPPATADAPATQERPKAERIAMNNMIFESVLHIRTPQSIEQFRGQFGSLSTQMRKLQSIDQRIEAALTTAEKDALTKVREQEVRDLQSKDDLFQKVYGFTAASTALRPNFILNTLIRLLTPVTDEELTTARMNKDFKESEVIVRDNAKFLHVSTLKSPAIQAFERDVKIMQANREAAIQLKAQVERLEGEDKIKAEEAFKAAEKKLTDDNAIMTKTYGFSLTRNYIAEALTAVFFVALTQEEVQRIAQQQNAETPKVEAKKDKPKVN
jgi:hypothetical protein